MRAGEIRHRAELLELDGDLQERCLGKVWVGIITQENAAPPAPAGLRNPIRVDIRARYNPSIIIGRYLRHDQRLFHVNSVRDPIGTRAELRVTADELMGAPGQVIRQRQAPKCCRVFLAFDVPYVSPDSDQGPVLRIYGEVALIEAGRVEQDDILVVGRDRYCVLWLAADSDDGVVRGLWLERMS